MSSYHLASDNAEAYFEAMRRYRVCYVWGYASSLYTLAQVALEQKLEPPNLKVAISNAEPLYDYQREAISEAFRCPVYTTYGMTEAVCAASECEAGYLHLWPEVGIVEVLDDVTDDPLPPGEVGRLVCTGLLNFNMPLIRYETGDRGAVAPLGEICACGRTLPIIRRIEGRMDDVIVTPDGRRIGRLDPVFKGAIPVIEAQIIQEHLENIRVRFVPAANYTESDGVEIVRQLQNYIGDIDIELEAVDRIPRTDNGKFRSVISKVNVK
jgi:phenylacetate-CoA ligase